MRVTFIRHGATEFTTSGRMCGQLDVPLSSWGRLQAHTLGHRLAGRPFDAIVTSPLARARDTAAVIGDALGLEPVEDLRFGELYLGGLEGQHTSVLRDDPTGFAARWKKAPARVRFPGGESMRDVARRAWAGLEDIHTQYPDGHVLVVSHMFAISALLCRILGVSVGRFRMFCVDVGSLSTVQLDRKAFRLMVLNDISQFERMQEMPVRMFGALPVARMADDAIAELGRAIDRARGS